MGKNSGAANYKIAELTAFLELVREHLPLGKDEWERVASIYNAQRLSGWPERDADSIKRKYRMLHSTRKPTGTAKMPEHIELAKKAKVAIDARAGVVDLDDGGDKDDGDADAEATAVWTAYVSAVRDEALDDSDAQLAALNDQELTPPSALLVDGSGSTVNAVTQPAAAEARGGCDTLPIVVHGQPRARPCDEDEALRYPRLTTSSDRLGGGDLIAMRDDIQRKRQAEEGIPIDASFAKQKRMRAEKSVSSMRKQLDSRDDAAAKNATDIFQLMLLLSEESERKADTRRADEEQRRREDQQERESRRRDEKEEKEERRRQDKQDADERARARMQEMMLLISALAK